MSEADARIDRLQRAYPEASYSALFHMPQALDEDAKKVAAFLRTWEAAEDLASMLESRVARLSERYREPFPGMTGPTFQEIGSQPLKRIPAEGSEGCGHGRNRAQRPSLQSVRRGAGEGPQTRKRCERA